MVLARLLSPEDFGLIALAGAVIAVVGYAGDLGLSDATIQKPEVTHAQMSSLFWVNTVVSLGLLVMNAALAPILVRIYDDERILLVSITLGAEFLFRGLGYQHQAVLNRTMRFKDVAIANTASIAGSAIIAIFCALGGLATGHLSSDKSLLTLPSWSACGLPVDGGQPPRHCPVV